MIKRTATATKLKKKAQEARKPEDVIRLVAEIQARDLTEEQLEKRTVTVSFSSETEKISFWGMRQVLLHEKKAVNLSRLRDVGAVLLNHDADQIIGRPANVRLDIEERRCRADIVFDDDADAERIFRKVQSGSLRGVSVGFRVSKWIDINEDTEWKSPEGRTFKGPMILAAEWAPIEFSLTPIPADPDVGVGRSSAEGDEGQGKHPAGQEDPETSPGMRTHKEQRKPMDPETRKLLEGLGLRKDATEQEAQAFLLAHLARKPEEKKPEERKEEPKATVTVGDTERREIENRAVEAERVRVEEIRDICGLHEETRDMADKLIKDGVKEDEARKLCLRQVLDSRKRIDLTSRVQFGEEERAKWTRAAEDSILLRVNRIRGESVEARTKAAREVEAFTLFDLARESLRRAHIYARGMSREEIIMRAMSHSTSDFPKILENAANKSMLQGWQEAPATWRPIVKVVPASDFKTMSRYKLGDFGDLEKTGELVPMPEGSIAEARETYAIDTYSKRFGISRQAIINDDLNAFDDIPSKMGEAARRLVSKLFYDLLISASGVGPTMAEDSKALFATDHPSGANYAAGTAAPDVAGLTIALKNMRLQKGLAATGETAPILSIMPAFLLVPAALEVPAKQTINSIADPAKSNSITENPFSRSMQLIVEGRLDGGTNGGTAFYTVASPSSISGAEIAFLNGQEMPTMIRVEGTNVLGIEWGIYSDVGVKFVEHRGWHRMKGVA